MFVKGKKMMIYIGPEGSMIRYDLNAYSSIFQIRHAALVSLGILKETKIVYFIILILIF